MIENNANFTQFRLQLYQHFNKRADTLLDLVDALSGNTQAHSVVELSLSPCFRRGYPALFKAIAVYTPKEAKKNLAQLAAPYIPQPEKRSFYLLSVDVTPQPRPYAYTLPERECIYQSSPVRSNKPITFGHPYSSLFILPERSGSKAPHWVIPCDTRRVNRNNKEETGANQVKELLEDKLMPIHDQLCVEVEDCGYSTPAYLAANRDKANLITITRARSNRVFCHSPDRDESQPCRGHVRWFGDKFDLRNPDTWGLPDETTRISLTGKRGKTYEVKLEGWDNILMRGKYKYKKAPMQNYPFTLVRVTQYDEEGKPVFANPMWLIVIGDRRRELSLTEIYEAYRQRYDVEHFFRFGKQKLLLDKYQTPDTGHEEKWWKLVHLAYLQLFVSRQYATNLPRPWEKYLPAIRERTASPSMVQRDMSRMIREFGTPACFPKPRGKSPGRQKGKRQPERKRQLILRSG